MSDDTESLPEPTSNRVVENGRNKSLKMSLGKKLTADKAMARMFLNTMVINGAQYCRPHLMIACHICEVDNSHVIDENNDEREELGLREVGDAGLNQRAEYWRDFIANEQVEIRLKQDILRQQHGTDFIRTHPEEWQKFAREASAGERQINDRFLAEVAKDKVTQCSYWACSNPTVDNLLQCGGCKIVKYCCQDHQAKDWKWEHKGECKLPEFLKAEIEHDRRRNLNGDYSQIER